MVPDIGTIMEAICLHGPEDRLIKVGPMKEGEVMIPEECAAIVVRAMVNRQREEVMTLKGKVGSG